MWRASSAGGRPSRSAIPLGTAHLPADRIGPAGPLASTALGRGPLRRRGHEVDRGRRARRTPRPLRRARREPARGQRDGRGRPASEDPPRRRQCRHARLREEAPRHSLRRRGGARRRGGPRGRPGGPARPRAHRRDDAEARRLRAGQGAPFGPADANDPRHHALGPRRRGGPRRGARGRGGRLPHQAVQRPRADGPRLRRHRAGPRPPRGRRGGRAARRASSGRRTSGSPCCGRRRASCSRPKSRT